MRTDLLWRAAVPAGALVALTLDAPPELTGGLALLGLALGAERAAERRAGSLADRFLTAVGGALVAVVLTGILIGSTTIGLRFEPWVVSLVVLSCLGLALALLVPRRDAAPRPGQGRQGLVTGLLLLPWVAGSVAVVAVAVNLSATSLSATEQEPLQLSLGRVSGTEVEVLVSATDPVGPLELRTTSDNTEVSYPTFVVGEDDSVTTTVSIPLEGRWMITLNYPDQTAPLRSIVLDR